MLNGTILGVHRQPVRFAHAFRQLRRSHRVGEFVSVYIQQDVCYIASDGGRCIPLHLWSLFDLNCGVSCAWGV